MIFLLYANDFIYYFYIKVSNLYWVRMKKPIHNSTNNTMVNIYNRRSLDFNLLVSKTISTSLSLIFCVFVLVGQSGHPHQIEWKYIKTPYQRIIYPTGKIEFASRIASIVEKMNEQGIPLHPKKLRTIDLVLQTGQVISNGYVGIGPYRSEFYSTPPQDFNFTGTTNWLDLLTIHEFRHVQQANYLDKGLIKIFHIAFGQAGWATAKFLAVPNWFDEGDAVMAETKLTSSGRGRTPEFFAQQRAIFLNTGAYRYSKARNGSFKDIVPNHYFLGYVFCNYIESQFGNESWPKILDRSANFQGIFYPFKKAIKNETGLEFGQLYKNAFTSLSEKLNMESSDSENDGNFKSIGYGLTSKPTFYKFPFFYGGEVFALKSGYHLTPSLIKIDGKEETQITTIGISQEDHISSNNEFVTWTEYNKNARWDFQNFADVYLYNLRSNEKSRITHKKKYFSPHPSSDGQSIAAIAYDTSLIAKLVIIESKSGQEKLNVSLIDNASMGSYPRWLSDNEIVYIAGLNGKVAIIKYDIKADRHFLLTDWTTNPITHLYTDNGNIVFSAGFGGIDNIYSLEKSNTIKRLTSCHTGAYTPAIHNDTLVYGLLEFKGMKLMKGPSLGQDYQLPSASEFIYRANATRNIVDESFPSKVREEKNFVRAGGFQLHSYFLNPSYTFPSLGLYFENTLSNISGYGTVGYNTNEKTTSLDFSLAYSPNYLVFDVLANGASRNLFLKSPADTFAINSFDEKNVGIQTRIPLSWVRGNYRTSFEPFVNYQYKWIQNLNSTVAPLGLHSFSNAEIGFTFTNRRRIAIQNVRTKYGQDVRINYYRALDGPIAQSIYAQGAIYFPSIFTNHSLKFSSYFRKEATTNEYRYADRFFYHRGGNNILSSKALKISAEYMLPLASVT